MFDIPLVLLWIVHMSGHVFFAFLCVVCLLFDFSRSTLRSIHSWFAGIPEMFCSEVSDVRHCPDGFNRKVEQLSLLIRCVLGPCSLQPSIQKFGHTHHQQSSGHPPEAHHERSPLGMWLPLAFTCPVNLHSWPTSFEAECVAYC